jgi:protein TonB
MLSFQYPDSQRAPEQKSSAKTISLVNLALIEPPALKKPLPPIPEPLLVKPEAPAAEPEAPAAEPEAPAETFISLEVPPESAGPSPEATGTLASLPSPSPAGSGNAAGIRAYLKSNYDYIQRHIRDKLIYPTEARRAGVQGVAELSFVIHTDGYVSNVRITVSSGSEALDASAVEAIYSAAPFRPPPNQARLIIPVAFRLR